MIRESCLVSLSIVGVGTKLRADTCGPLSPMEARVLGLFRRGLVLVDWGDVNMSVFVK